MEDTVVLTQQTNVQSSMEPHWMWYLAGAFDTIGTIAVKFNKSDSMKLGYEITPLVKFTRRKDQKRILGMFDEYCDDHSIYYRTESLNDGDTIRLIIDRNDDVRIFLESLIDGMIQQREAAEIMLDEILPKLESTPSTKEEMLDLMDDVEALRNVGPHPRNVKYTKQFFENEL